MVVAQIFFRKEENVGPISKEEMFIMFSVFQSRPINFAAFLLACLDNVDNSITRNIYVGGTVTHIALTLGLYNQVAYLAHIYGYNLLDLDHCLNRGLVRREGPNEFKILILNDVVQHFVLPNEKTSVYNHES